MRFCAATDGQLEHEDVIVHLGPGWLLNSSLSGSILLEIPYSSVLSANMRRHVDRHYRLVFPIKKISNLAHMFCT